MGGLVGVIAQETARYSMFASSMTDLDLPEGTTIKWWFGHDIADNANALVREMYRQDKDWLWLMGDDHVFGAELLNGLLAHNKDIVVPLCLMRNPPYRPVIFSDWEKPYRVAEASYPVYKRERVNLDDYPDGGLTQIHSAGSAGMLIKREVFDRMSDPWFEAGVSSTVHLGEDFYFCDKARDAGFDIFCDLDSMLGHCTVGVVWPVREHDGWTFAFSMVGGFQVTMPPALQAYADEVGNETR